MWKRRVKGGDSRLVAIVTLAMWALARLVTVDDACRKPVAGNV